MMEKKRFIGLDGLRGVCALSVLLFHCETLVRPGVIFCHGYLAVDVFFLLSGFVIAASYDHRLQAGMPVRRFMMARLRRLAPVYWAGLVLGVIATVVITFYHPGVTAARIALWGATAAALIPSFDGSEFSYPADPVAWTLAWELIVNLAYALWLRRWSSRNLILLALVMWAAATANATVNPRAWSFGMTPADIWLGGLRALPGFVMGAVLHRLYRAGRLERLPAVSPLLPVTAWLSIAVMPQSLPPLFDLAVVLVAAPLLVALLARAGRAPGWFATLGGLSYPLYASHLALVYLARRTPLFGLEQGPDPLRAAGLVLLAIACAWVLYRTVDPAGKGRKAGKIPALAAPRPLGSSPV
jgi:peptidoglycan/LPS O-acetylase OafA/YrhL